MWKPFNIWEKMSKGINVIIGLLLVVLIAAFIEAIFSEKITILQTWLAKHSGERWGILEFIISVIVALGSLIATKIRVATHISAERGLLQERFNTANEHLSSDKESLRISSFREFFDLAKDDKKNYGQPVLDALCEHLREKAAYNRSAIPDILANTPIKNIHSEEVITLVDILFGENAEHVFNELDYDLRNTNLSLFNIKLNSARKVIDFREALLEWTTINGGDLSNSEFEGAYLYHTNFQGTILYKATFTKAELLGTRFEGVDLKLARFEDITNMSNANFIKSNLHKTKFINVDFCRSIFKETNIQAARILLGKYDDHTEFPEGFNPKDKKYSLEHVKPNGESK